MNKGSSQDGSLSFRIQHKYRNSPNDSMHGEYNDEKETQHAYGSKKYLGPLARDSRLVRCRLAGFSAKVNDTPGTHGHGR